MQWKKILFTHLRPDMYTHLYKTKQNMIPR